MTIFPRRLATTLAVAICCAAFGTAAQADPAGKWRVEFEHYTGNDGAIVLRISPEGGTPVDVETKVAKSSSPDKVARSVRDSIKVALGEGYHVETDDGEDVIIGKKGNTPKLNVTLVSSSLTGLATRINRE